jgi:hypothetical protein
MVVSEPIIKAFHFWVYETTRFISPFIDATEWVLTIAAVLLIFLLPRRASSLLNDIHDALGWIAERRGLAILSAGLLPVCARLFLIRISGYPKPSIHDEFSHLLLADTLVSGHLTNPTHPMWRHFESIHIIQRPTYNSMYPPGQAIFLALGQWLFHHPWFGVLISMGLMSMAVCWMLQAYLSPIWAFYGTILMGLKIGIVSFWMNGYMGGAVGGIGGALVVGSLPRLSRRVTPLSGLCLAGGACLLMNSRPFEGGLLTAAVLLILAFRLRREWAASARLLIKPALPGLCLFALGVALTGYYCFRVTGSPLRMPYVVNRDTYGWPENLAFLPPKQIHSVHPLLTAMYEKELQNRHHYASVALAIDSLATRIFDCWTFFVGPLLTIPMFFIPRSVRRSDQIVLAGLLGLEAFINLFQLLLYPQHLAHVTGVIFALLTLGIASVYGLLRGVSLVRARYFALLLPLFLVGDATLHLFGESLGVPMSYWERAYEIHRDARYMIEEGLEARSLPQLVIVHYEPTHSPDEEWVYNRANIDHAKVIWARDMGKKENDELARYFATREVWFLNVDRLPIVPVPYRTTEKTAHVLSTQLTKRP